MDIQLISDRPMAIGLAGFMITPARPEPSPPGGRGSPRRGKGYG